jgi:hypothetical protein
VSVSTVNSHRIVPFIPSIIVASPIAAWKGNSLVYLFAIIVSGKTRTMILSPDPKLVVPDTLKISSVTGVVIGSIAINEVLLFGFWIFKIFVELLFSYIS